jgi:exonuclease SbcC
MELKKLNLKNFRTHRKLEINFQQGITGIVGTNGAGKSSIVEAIIFLFTGEGYGFKADMLSVGEESGYVIGHIDINGKEAVLERHLDTSKVAFKYDGITYKKSGEVAEIWDKLFQIDKNIFKNIVVAKQGDIALLFSGDNSTKEKIFQKIFLVPNTTKVRDVIWNKYIKTAPPEYPLLDENQYISEIEDIKKMRDTAQIELAKFPPDLSDTYADLISRSNYLVSCRAAESKRIEIADRIAALEARKEEIKGEITKIDSKLATVDIAEITSSLEKLKLSRPLYEKKTSFEKQLAELQSKKPAEPTAEDISELEYLHSHKGLLQAGYDNLSKEYNESNQTIQTYKEKGLVDVDNCPHCGSTLKDIGEYISHVSKKVEELQSKIVAAQKELSEVTSSISDIEYRKVTFDNWNSDNVKVLAGLDPIKDISFDQNDYEIYSAVVSQYSSFVESRKTLVAALNGVEDNLIAQNMSNITLTTYDYAKITIEVEEEYIASRIKNIKEDQEKQKLKQNELSGYNNLLTLKQEELDRNNRTKEQNKVRNKYVNILNEIYEMLATSQFPRKLIQTYSSTVSEYLSENLRQFNFPYRAEVNDSFGIDVFDYRGRKLPCVSGGQEIMVGVALRLALHSMFGEAFPMMIFDEGSVHLSQESKKNYFEVIKNMKNMSKLKQIIIIDHDEDLSDVVDNTIKL